ncbi:MAG: glucose-6-phosphate isomerase [Candidatus Hadarchaeota archaeon]
MTNHELMDPFGEDIDLESGIIEDASDKWTRYLSDMDHMYLDQDAVEEILEKDDPLLYEVYEIGVPKETGQLIHCTTVLYPGKVGNEYYMTKGHYHEKRGTAESYLCLSGEGYLLTQTEEGDAKALRMVPGRLVYIPPYWAHRTVNTGDEPFIFFGVYPGDAGHDYGSIDEVGFPQIVVEEKGETKVKENPDYEVK